MRGNLGPSNYWRASSAYTDICTAQHLDGVMVCKLQTSDLETDVESFSPPPNDKLQSRPDLSPAGREAVGRLEAGPTKLAKWGVELADVARTRTLRTTVSVY